MELNIILICHKPIDMAKPRGAERSVRAIVEYLIAKGHNVDAVNDIPQGHILPGIEYDVVLSWGRPAYRAFQYSQEIEKPFVLMVRFWKNIAPLPAGNLMARPLDEKFIRKMSKMFEGAAAIITNTEYSKKVIHRWHDVTKGRVHVSYVPIGGEFESRGKRDGNIILVTPEIYGEYNLIGQLATRMPNEKFHVINCDFVDKLAFETLGPNVEAFEYRNMDQVWSSAKLLLMPAYKNDICGTRRVTIEACRHGIPVIAMNKCGMNEKVPMFMLVSQKGHINEWIEKIEEINKSYDKYQGIARTTWESYNTLKQLEQFEKILIQCTKKKQKRTTG